MSEDKVIFVSVDGVIFNSTIYPPNSEIDCEYEDVEDLIESGKVAVGNIPEEEYDVVEDVKDDEVVEDVKDDDEGPEFDGEDVVVKEDEKASDDAEGVEVPETPEKPAEELTEAVAPKPSKKAASKSKGSKKEVK